MWRSTFAWRPLPAWAVLFPVLLLLALFLSTSPVHAADSTRPELARLFAAQGLEGCFAAETAQGLVRVNPARCAQPFRPASTFKIVNALTAFEYEVALTPSQVIAWDGVERELPEWNRDLTLKEAFRLSAVWYFIELGRRNGRRSLAESMRRLDYGTADASGSEKFWIDGPLVISADQQVRSLGRLARGEAGFRPRSLDMLRQVMLLEKGEWVDGEWRLYGKTGTAPSLSAADPAVGWFVGWVERAGAVRPFALNVSPHAPGVPLTPAQTAARLTLAKAMLRALGVLPPS